MAKRKGSVDASVKPKSKKAKQEKVKKQSKGYKHSKNGKQEIFGSGSSVDDSVFENEKPLVGGRRSKGFGGNEKEMKRRSKGFEGNENEKPLVGGRRSKGFGGKVKSGQAAQTAAGGAAKGKKTRGKKSEEKVAVKQEEEEDVGKSVVSDLAFHREHGDSEEDSGEDTAVKKSEGDDDDDDESDEEWEEVEELSEPVPEGLAAAAVLEPGVPTKPVEIEIETPEQAKKRERREKRKAEFETYLRRMVNRFNKELRVETHKVHLLCLLANGFFRNGVCNQVDLQAISLSIIPAQYTKVPPEKMDLFFLSNLVKWFIAAFSLNPNLSVDEGNNLQSALERSFGNYSIRDEEEMVHVFLIILRALKLMCRLVLSLHPVPLKEVKDQRSSKGKTSSSASQESPGQSNKAKSASRKSAPSKKRAARMPEKGLSDDSDKEDEEPGEELRKQAPSGAKRPSTEKAEPRKSVKRRKATGDHVVKLESTVEGPQRPKNNRRRRVASKVSYKEDSKSDENSDSDFELPGGGDSDFSDDGSGTTWKDKRRASGLQKTTTQEKRKETGTPAAKAARSSGVKNLKREEESEEECDQGSKTSKKGSVRDDAEAAKEASGGSGGCDQWLEVYLEKMERWVCVDPVRGSVNQAKLCYKHASKPVYYIVGVDNNGYVKDVTRRYDAAWMTITRKQRIDSDWWEETLEPYQNPFVEKESKEEMELQAKLLDQPLPTVIGEYKNHPLYALERHLLKYEAIFPCTAAVLGYCRGEAVYSRDCVHILHSRDTWLKEARVVRLGEVPYKMVKGHSNRARKARVAEPENREKNDLGLFGSWQTEEYQPPVAVDGKVPRNDYGNVYLFKPCMLPVGCVHLHVPSLHKVARKLDIDCVPAVTGFDFHSGYSHPVVDGYIVCEEYQDLLLAAWDKDQAEMEQKKREKREKRVLANWKLLVKSLLIRERLKERYGSKNDKVTALGQAGGSGFSSDEAEEDGPGSQKPAGDLSCSWPQNRQTTQQEGKIVRRSKREKRGEEKHLFPFEKK
ncbi:DNA repair protein complementing XP-C cells isoform X2 [Latimeria chalumnae]|uniref:DNA repair protein complementing XP-C cells isoform X2 n=1 Tax=Latimeria chalumnae TaxID=7897 RepID=UPI00313DE49D